MRIGFLDFETNGLPHTSDITEVGLVIYNLRAGMHAIESEFSSLVYENGYPNQTPQIIELTGITDEMLLTEGRSPVIVVSEIAALMETLDYAIAHNKSFDKGIVEDKFTKYGIKVPRAQWICSLHDIPYDKKYKCKKLSHLAYDHGILVDPSTLHRALDDVKLLARLILEKYDIEKIVQYAKSPWVYLRCMASGPWIDGGVSSGWAKANGYGWEGVKGTEEKYPKCWVKRIKKFELEENLKSPYEIIILKEG